MLGSGWGDLRLGLSPEARRAAWRLAFVNAWMLALPLYGSALGVLAEPEGVARLVDAFLLAHGCGLLAAPAFRHTFGETRLLVPVLVSAAATLAVPAARGGPALGLFALMGVASGTYLGSWLVDAGELSFRQRALAVGAGVAAGNVLLYGFTLLLPLLSNLAVAGSLSALLLAAGAALRPPRTPKPGSPVAPATPDAPQPQQAGPRNVPAASEAAPEGDMVPWDGTSSRLWPLLLAATYLGIFQLYFVGGVIYRALAPFIEHAASGAGVIGVLPYAFTALLAGRWSDPGLSRLFVITGFAALGASLGAVELLPAPWGGYGAQALVQGGWGLLDVTLWAELGSFRARGHKPIAATAGLVFMVFGILSGGWVAAGSLSWPAQPTSTLVLGMLGLFLALPLLTAGRVQRKPSARELASMPAAPAPDPARWPPERLQASIDQLFTELGLTPREREVARMLVTDRVTLKEICAALYISRNTLRTHLRHIYSKCGVSGREELARLVQRGLAGLAGQAATADPQGVARPPRAAGPERPTRNSSAR